MHALGVNHLLSPFEGKILPWFALYDPLHTLCEGNMQLRTQVIMPRGEGNLDIKKESWRLQGECRSYLDSEAIKGREAG